MSADITWILKRLSVGGGIFTAENMEDIAARGITHIIDTQLEFDDSPLAELYNIKVCWCGVKDDYSAPDPKEFDKAIDFFESCWGNKENKLHIHCAGGVHRGPMFALLILVKLGKTLNEGMDMITSHRPISDFPHVYSRAVERYFEEQRRHNKSDSFSNRRY